MDADSQHLAHPKSRDLSQKRELDTLLPGIRDTDEVKLLLVIGHLIFFDKMPVINPSSLKKSFLFSQRLIKKITTMNACSGRATLHCGTARKIPSSTLARLNAVHAGKCYKSTTLGLVLRGRLL